MSPYVGGKLTTFFDDGAQRATQETARHMANKGASRIDTLAKDNTPVDTGHLRASWEQIPAVPEVRGGTPAWIARVRNAASYAADVENGTGLWGPEHAPYIIRPKMPGGVLRWVGKDGKVVFARSVLHQGSPGNHMLAIAMNVTAGEIEGGALFEGDLQLLKRTVEANAMRGTV